MSERRFNLTPEQVEHINPNTKTVPVFRSRGDAELAAKIYDRIPGPDRRKAAPRKQWMGRFVSHSHLAYGRGLCLVPHFQSVTRNGVSARR